MLELGTAEVRALQALVAREPNAVPGTLRERLRPAPELRQVQLADPEDNAIRRGLQCPWCEAIIWDGDQEGIRVVDVAVRWSTFGYAADNSAIVGDYNDDSEFETDQYQCESCDREVELPHGITEN